VHHRVAPARRQERRGAGLTSRRGVWARWTSVGVARYLPFTAMNENFSLIVMCLFLLGSLAFLAQQLTSYH
jgi:hypothetical protein